MVSEVQERDVDGWKRITSMTFAKVQHTAVHRGEAVTTLALPLRAEPLDVKHALETWGVPFPATWSPTGSGPH